jgi:hypothetical protein
MCAAGLVKYLPYTSLHLTAVHYTNIMFHLLKPTGYVMHHQLTIQQFQILSTLYAFCIYLRTNSDMCHLYHKLIGFNNRDEKCLLRGKNWVLKKVVCASS